MPDKSDWPLVAGCSIGHELLLLNSLTGQNVGKKKQAKQSQQTGFLGLFSISLCSDSIRWFRPSNKLWYNKHLFISHNLPILVEFTFCVFFYSWFCSVVPSVLLPNLYKNLESRSFGYNPTEPVLEGLWTWMKQHVWQLSSAHNLVDKLHWGQEHEPVTSAQTHI